MGKNFKVRVSVGLIIFIVALISLYTFNGKPFKILFALFALMSAIELFSFFKRKDTSLNRFLALLEIIMLIWGTIYVSYTSVENFWYIILGVPGYDVAAYLFGKKYGGKIFKNSRPFPKISKNKTWEGTICGLITAISAVAILLAIRGDFANNWLYLLCGPLALIGDLFESYLKRKFSVKDSNEIVIKNPKYQKLELLVGGSEGHGGFLDRIDSTAFTCTVLLIISSLI